MPRGIVAVYAMARPARPERERELVRELTAGMGGTARARATRAARLVAAEAVAFLAADPDDVTDRVLLLARASLSRTPAYLLATCPEIDTAAIVLGARTRRFQARGGRQIGPDAWARETEEVVAETSTLLAERFRRHLRK